MGICAYKVEGVMTKDDIRACFPDALISTMAECTATQLAQHGTTTHLKNGVAVWKTCCMEDKVCALHRSIKGPILQQIRLMQLQLA